jgi:arginase family enzyme
VGTREILLRPEHVRKYYTASYGAADFALDPAPALRGIRRRARAARRVFIDLDCDVFDPAYFPATSNCLPFGLSPQQVLQLINAAWSGPVHGVVISEFEPARDQNDRSLATLLWLVEHLLLKLYETQPKHLSR